MLTACLSAASLLAAGRAPAWAGNETGTLDPVAALEQAVSAAERSLREGDSQGARSRYRFAMSEGWLLMGTLATLEGRLPAAREAFRTASSSGIENRRALQSLALAHLRMGEAAEAVQVLTPLAAKDGRDTATRRLLAQALVAAGRPDEAVRELEAARAAAPGDLEVVFALGAANLHRKEIDVAARQFADVVRGRPIPQTRVLIGRTYLDFGEYDRARRELRAALKQDPRVRRAHYYLAMAAATEGGRAALEEAIRELQAELKLAPGDEPTNLQLGVALVESQRHEDALPALEIAAGAEPPQSRTLYYLGRAQLGMGRVDAAAASLKRALDLARAQGASGPALRAVHMQLGQALRKLGDAKEAETQFAEAERLSAAGTEAEREQLARYLADEPGAEAAMTPVVPVIETSPLAALPRVQRLGIERRVTAALTRACLNLGVLEVRDRHFLPAAELFEKAAALDPDFPQVQSSLGVAYFNAGQFEKATGPLGRALAAGADTGLKRMLALSWFNIEAYDKAAELLRDDPELATDFSLQFTYGVALVKSDRSAEAERVFAGLLARHGESAELHVLLGQAHAQQGDFESAVRALERALALKADVAEASATLGTLYLRQGRLPEAEQALRAELRHHPGDLRSQQNLAVVLDALQRPQEAIPLLRGVLQSNPQLSNARYLLGKMLLGQGAAEEAVEHLEAAARQAPEDANIPYQLGQAYQKLGRTELAEKQFEVFRELKARR